MTRDGGVLKITDPAWQVVLDFVRPDVAIRKSERNLPPQPRTPSQEPVAGAHPPAYAETISRGDFDRAKTLVAIRLDVASAGDQPLAPPYRLVLITPRPWPPGFKIWRVYQFLSFEEFRLDLRRMITSEMEEWSLWTAAVAFVLGLPPGLVRQLKAKADQKRMANEALAQATASLAEAISTASRSPAPTASVPIS